MMGSLVRRFGNRVTGRIVDPVYIVRLQRPEIAETITNKKWTLSLTAFMGYYEPHSP